MLQFELRQTDLAGPWVRIGPRWVSGDSYIKPYPHDLLRAEHSVQPGYLSFAVRESRPHGDTYHLSIQPAEGAVVILAGHAGVAPLYLATDGGVLRGSWDVVDLRHYASRDDLCDVSIIRLLTRRQRYSNQTVFKSIQRVTAGSSARWDGLTVDISYPVPVAHPRPRAIRPGADPVDFFAKLLADTVANCANGPTAVEMSGGLDSANIALAACGGRALVTGGLIMPGPVGVEQARRREIISHHLGVPDLTIDALEHLPFAPHGPRRPERAHSPDGDVYREAFDALRARLAARGTTAVMTGFGGDEVMGLTPSERSETPRTRAHPTPDWLAVPARFLLDHVDDHTAPVTAVALPTLMVSAARHPAYLRHGLWPIAPYTHPAVTALGRSLPVTWRTRKRLLRATLGRAGLPTSVTHPQHVESFTDVMTNALRENAACLLDAILDRSPLLDRGLLDVDAVYRLRRQARHGAPLPALTYDLIATDIGIQSMCQ